MPKSNLVQKELMGFKNKEILAATENALENLPSHKILFNNGKVEEAHAWLNDPSPCYSKYVMNSFNFIEALNLKLLFPASPPKGSFCNCRNKLVNDPFHFLNCFNTNGVRKARHDAIRDRLYDFMVECEPHITIEKEQAIPLKNKEGSSVISDIATVSATRSFQFIDVSFVNSAAASHLKNKDPLDERCIDKYNKYKNAIDDNVGSYAIIPFVLDITGKMHREARRFVEQISRMGSSPYNSDKFKKARKIFLRDVNIISMNENGFLIRSGKLYYRK